MKANVQPAFPLQRRSRIYHQIKRYRYVYLLFLPAFATLLLFNYGPMYGVIIAFKDYKFAKGIWGSNWTGLSQFIRMFQEDTFLMVLRNTFFISFLKILFAFPAAIFFALMLNEVRRVRMKKFIQTVSYLPHFVSWIVIAGLIREILSMNGPVNGIVQWLGGSPQLWLTSSFWFVPIVIISDIWQSFGWSSIIFLAAIAGIDRQLYEAAVIDGASRLQSMRYITLPSLLPVIMILLLLRIGHIFNAGFDQIFNLYSPLVYSSADIIDTYTYRVGLINNDFSYATAIGLFKNLVGIALLLTVNHFSKTAKHYGF